ncbi:hypothetical protein AX769_08830 [Frondihabitans sp. PAMC 28766]|uniref:SdrD B-like domain-containing protein n=1 Tax=Frondihabitans sp. PAMC 28766 TaxID=1795630 RepID=UPI00078ED576|nr:SdrD B-like domain-containing protein [Frondihabitans sp. PAMC 28766]AMM20248.1 hypothetical protein AX769_08830 [Frondihabitans sp. PAMC 28766]
MSAAPRFDLAINTVTPSFAAAVGPDGSTPGHRIVYPVLVDYKGLAAGANLLGYERLAGDVSFTDDVSRMFGRGESPAALLPVGSEPACGINTGQVPGAPGGRGGGDDSVVDSGTFSCSQEGPGEPISVHISGVDSSLSSVPTKSVSGGAIAGGTKAYVVSGYISLWIPEPASLQTLTAVNTYRDLSAPSVTQQADFGGVGEPLGNNSVSRNVGTFLGVKGSLRYWGVDLKPEGRFELSGKYNKPYTTPGQLIRPVTSVGNEGTDSWRGSIVCTAFDNSYQTLDDSTGVWAGSSASGITGRPQFAAFRSSTADGLRDATCGDDDATWYDDPNDVPGGAAAVGLVRWKFDFPAAATESFYASLKVADRVPDYTRLRTFASILPGGERDWVHDTVSGAQANGSWADFLTVTADLARITSKVVDDGFTATTTPDKTQYVEQGGSVSFALYPTLTNATVGGDPDTVTVRDVLPRGTRLVEGSATPRPASVTEETDGNGDVRQVVTWRFPEHAVNAALPTITFTVRADHTAAVGPTTNNASITSTRDISDSTFQTSDRALHVLAVGAVSVVEEAVRPGVVVGDDLEWRLRYSNNAASAFDSTDLITVLPHVGDGRGTTTATSLEHTVTPLASEVVRYTSADPKSIDVDAAAASNGASGSTKWCTEAKFGTKGCPSSLATSSGVRIVHSASVGVGATVEHKIGLSAHDAHDRDLTGSSFGLRVQNLSLPVVSNTATIREHAGAIGHRVWFDKNSDGLQDDGEPGVTDQTIQLTGTDDRGDGVDRRTTTGDDGRYSFDDLRPGDYRVQFGTADGGWTKAHIGDDAALDSNVDADGNATTSLEAEHDGDSVTAVSSDLNVDAGALPKLDPGVPPVVRPPGHGNVVDRPSHGGDPTDASASHGPKMLALTGSTIGLWAVAAGLLALLIGTIIVIVSRRRERGESGL